MKRKSLLLLLLSITGIAIAIIIALAINTHLKLSALEPEGHGNESAEEVLNEIITGKPSNSETTTEEGSNHNENIETSHSE
jgi:hypothetical protein